MQERLRFILHQRTQQLHYFYKQNPKRAWLICAALVLAIILIRVAFNLFWQQKDQAPRVAVALATASIQDVPVYYAALGTVNPVYTITVKTQINGTLTHVYFQEGQYVKAGTVLAQIDPRPYQAQLLQYQGQLMRDQALLDNARIDLQRYQKLYRTKSVSQQTLNTQQSLVKQDQGIVKIDQGQIDAVKTNLIYCNITTPVSGRIGIQIVNPGNFVQTSDASGIAVVTSMDPIYVIFSLPEDQLTTASEAFHSGKPLIVQALDRNKNKLLAQGVLSAIDNQVNTATGTVNFKAKFDNSHYSLFPNQFVNVNLQVNTLPHAVIIPTAAIQQGAQGTYVYRYNTNQTVSSVPVKTDVTYGAYTVISSGIKANQRVVTEGTDKLFDGASVMVSGKVG